MATLETRSTINDIISVSTTSKELFTADNTRDFFIITNQTAGETLTIKLGDGDATANAGATLSQGQSYGQSDGGNFKAWRGRICAIATGATDVARQSMSGV